MPFITEVPFATEASSPMAALIPVQEAPASSIAAGQVHFLLLPLVASQEVLAAAREMATEPALAAKAASIAPIMRLLIVQLVMPVVQPVVSAATIAVASSVTIVDKASTATAIDSSLVLDRKPMELVASEVAAVPWAYSHHWAS